MNDPQIPGGWRMLMLEPSDNSNEADAQILSHFAVPEPSPVLTAAYLYSEMARTMGLHDPYREALEPALRRSLSDEAERMGGRTVSLDLGLSPLQVSRMDFRKNPVPTVLRGLARGSAALSTWSPEYFRERYGGVEATIGTPDGDHRGPLSEVADDMIEERETGRYIQNVADIFNAHPELEAQLELGALYGSLGFDRDFRHIGSQLFFGGAKTNTQWHCANMYNVFVNVWGRKRWYFAHPKQTALMNGYFHEVTGVFAYSECPHVDPTEAPPDHPFRGVTVFQVELEPGDVLINPPWWWHRVINATVATIAVATRLKPIEELRPQVPYDVLQAVNSNWQHIKREMELNEGFRITDEMFRNKYVE